MSEKILVNKEIVERMLVALQSAMKVASTIDMDAVRKRDEKTGMSMLAMYATIATAALGCEAMLRSAGAKADFEAFDIKSLQAFVRRVKKDGSRSGDAD